MTRKDMPPTDREWGESKVQRSPEKNGDRPQSVEGGGGARPDSSNKEIKEGAEQLGKVRRSLERIETGEEVLPIIKENRTSRSSNEYIRAVLYEVIFDRFLQGTRESIRSFIGQNSKVLDMGCGTGALAFDLARHKNCTVHGIDLASGRIARAQQRRDATGFAKATFATADATRLVGISDKEFDFTTMSLFLHALPQDIQYKVLQEAVRVSKRLLIADFVTKTPFNISGLAIRGAELAAGKDHFQHFISFKAAGGIDGLLRQAGLTIAQEQINRSQTIRTVLVEDRS